MRSKILMKQKIIEEKYINDSNECKVMRDIRGIILK